MGDWRGATTQYVNLRSKLTDCEDFCQLTERPTSPPPQKWSNLHERCPQCWIKWKITFPILFFELWLILFTIYWWHTWIFKHITNQKQSNLQKRCAMRTLSQLTTSRPLPLSFNPSSMKDTECAECNKKNNKHFSDFYFSSYHENFIENCGAECWRHKNDHNSKNKIGKILNFCFSFDSAHFRSFM